MIMRHAVIVKYFAMHNSFFIPRKREVTLLNDSSGVTAA
jgi:hypothetical protein